MKMAITLSAYISRQFMVSFLVVCGIFSTLIMLIDAIELLRKASSREIPFLIMVDMVALKLPMILQVILPFITLVASVLAYTNLARRSELVVIRSAGVSVWEFLLPSVITAFCVGLIVIFALSPLSSLMLNKYERLNAKYFENKQNLLDISETGLWFKQEYQILPGNIEEKEVNNEMIIHSQEVTGSKDIILGGVEIIALDSNYEFAFRVDAPQAIVKDNFLQLKDVTITDKENQTKKVSEYNLATNLKQDDIQNSFADPQSISFFELPTFINKLEKSGFSALGHILQWHKIMSSPFFYAGMVLIGAIFSLKAPRQGMIGYSITFTIIFGFIIYFLSNLVSSIGLSGSIPIIVSAWTPVIITIFIGVGLLLHYEDG